MEGANGPTNSRAGGIRLIEGKARTDFDPLFFVRLTVENVRFFKVRPGSSSRPILTTHPCSSFRPMARMVLAGTL